MKVAAIQMVSGPSCADNLRVARYWLEQAADAGVQLAALPEYFGLMGLHDSDKWHQREAYGRGPMQDFVAQAASDLGLWIVGGTLPLTAEHPDKVRNASMVWNPQGQCVARYDKVHLFELHHGSEHFDEGRVIEAGQHPVQFEMPDATGVLWRWGLSVCYDLRFPEMYRQHADAGVHGVLVPSAFTHTTGQAHWQLLLRARAVENLSYVVAPGQGGTHPNGRRTWGHSCVVEPWGKVLAEHEQGAGMAVAELSMPHLQAMRAQLPALGHRVM